MKTRFSFSRQSRPFPKDFSAPMARIASYAVSTAQRRIMSGVPPANSTLTQAVKGNSLTLRDTGNYLASISGTSGSTWAQAGTKERQARMLQEGGVIRPKRARSLAIPASSRTRTMMRRYGLTPRACIQGMKADGYQIWTTKLSKVIWARKGKKGQPFKLFILRKSVRIPSRPHLYIDQADEIVILSMLEQYIGFRR